MSDQLTCDSTYLSGNRGGKPCGNPAKPIGTWARGISVSLCPAHLGLLRKWGRLGIDGGPDDDEWDLVRSKRTGDLEIRTAKGDRLIDQSRTRDQQRTNELPGCAATVYRKNFPERCARKGLHAGTFSYDDWNGVDATLDDATKRYVSKSLCRAHRDACLKLATHPLTIYDQGLARYPYTVYGTWTPDEKPALPPIDTKGNDDA